MADVKISALNSYTTPLDADVLPVVDTANTTTKKVTWANLKATLKTYFDTLYQAAGTYLTAAGAATLTNKIIDWASNTVTMTLAQLNTALSDADVASLAGNETLLNKTLTSPVFQATPVVGSGGQIVLTVPTVDDTATGFITNGFNSGYSSSAIGDVVYLDSSSTWQKADADLSAAAYSGILGIALEVKASGAALKVLLRGFAYCSTAFPALTVGSPVYLSATAGAITHTAPATTDSATRLLGYAVHADKIWFNPSNDWLTHT